MTYGVYYCAASEESAIGELLQVYRGQTLTSGELLRFGFPLALVEIEFADANLIDLDDPAQLIAHKTRPSIVASTQRNRTQELARRIFYAKADGISWWSTLVADWTNYSIFTIRDAVGANIRSAPVELTLARPSVAAAAGKLGIRLAKN